jgi:hypothetical protein
MELTLLQSGGYLSPAGGSKHAVRLTEALAGCLLDLATNLITHASRDSQSVWDECDTLEIDLLIQTSQG